MKTIILLSATLCVLFAATPGYAKPNEGRNGGKPPKEAVEACEGKAENDTVSFVTPRGDEMTAVCRNIEDTLVAVPAKGKKKAD